MTSHRLKNVVLWIIGTTLSLNLIFLVKDLSDDFAEGAGPWHIIPEILIVLGTVIIAVCALKLFLRTYLNNDRMKFRISELENSSIAWQQRTRLYTEGLAQEIDQQMSDWNLTQAEKEIALLLLKGLSIKEIGEVRQTTEQTIKQQSSAIYKKSGIGNRSELSAFFLEDLLFPLDIERPHASPQSPI